MKKNNKFQRTFRVTCPKMYSDNIACKEPELTRRCFYCNIAKLMWGDQDVTGEPLNWPVTMKCTGMYIEEIEE